MAFGCFKPSKEKEEVAVAVHEYTGSVDPSASTSADLASSTQPSEIKETHRKRFWSFGGKKGKKLVALRADLNQQTEIINSLKDTMKTEKEAYEDQINRLQAALDATENKLKSEEEKNKKLRAAKEEMIKTREAEKKMISENMTLIEKIFAPPPQETTDHLSANEDTDVTKKSFKKKNSLLRQKKRDQKNEIHVAAEIGDGNF